MSFLRLYVQSRHSEKLGKRLSWLIFFRRIGKFKNRKGEIMKNADLPAMPFAELDAGCSVSIGLTKREMFAMHFHAALLTANNSNGQWKGTDAGAEIIEIIAIIEADALLAELEK